MKRNTLLMIVGALGWAAPSIAQGYLVQPGQPPRVFAPAAPGLYATVPQPQPPQFAPPPMLTNPGAPQIPGRQFQMPPPSCAATPQGVVCR